MTENFLSQISKKTLKTLLQSIVRFSIRRGIKIQEFEDTLKEVYVSEAKKYLIENKQELNLSKISVITGIQRFAIEKFTREQEVVTVSKKENAVDSQDKVNGVNLITKIIGAWQTNAKYIRADGKPRVLNVEGKQSEFADLIKSITTAINPYTVLFELERAGLVEKNNKGGLKLKYGSQVSGSDIEQGLSFYSLDFNDLTESVEENIFNTEQKLKNHHLTTEYDSVSINNIDKVKTLFLKEGNKFHLRLRKIISKFETKDLINEESKKNEVVRVSFCSFSRIG